MFWCEGSWLHIHLPVAVVRACRDRALLLMAVGFGGAVTPLLALVTPSLGVLVVVAVLQLGTLVGPWLPAWSELLLGRSSCLVPAAAETITDADRKKKKDRGDLKIL